MLDVFPLTIAIYFFLHDSTNKQDSECKCDFQINTNTNVSTDSSIVSPDPAFLQTPETDLNLLPPLLGDLDLLHPGHVGVTQGIPDLS